MELDNGKTLALLKRVAAGDEGAFRQLYDAMSRRVYGYALHTLKDPVAAKEVVTETLYQLWKTPEKFRGDAKFSTWVLGIARHKTLDRIPSKESFHENIDELADSLESDEPDAFDRLAEQQRRESVKNCMAKLSDTHRECLYLVFYEGLSLAEVSQVQSVPENTIKTRLFHARNNIKKCLKLLLEREGFHG